MISLGLRSYLRGPLRHFLQINIVLNVKEAAHRSSADWALVSLHPHDLRAVDTQAHVSAGQHHGVFVGRVADHALFLALVLELGSIVVVSVNII